MTDSRSSCEIGLMRRMRWRSRLRLLLGRLGNHRLRLVGLVIGRRKLFLVVAGHRVLELAHPLAQRASQVGKPLGPEDQQHDDEDYDDLERAYTERHGLMVSGG